jgi:hypothetical protein
MYVYYPREDAVIAFALNSMPGEAGKVYKTLHHGGRL